MIEIKAKNVHGGCEIEGHMKGNGLDIITEIIGIMKHFEKNCPLELACAIKYLSVENKEKD